MFLNLTFKRGNEESQTEFSILTREVACPSSMRLCNLEVHECICMQRFCFDLNCGIGMWLRCRSNGASKFEFQRFTL